MLGVGAAALEHLATERNGVQRIARIVRDDSDVLLAELLRLFLVRNLYGDLHSLELAVRPRYCLVDAQKPATGNRVPEFPNLRRLGLPSRTHIVAR
jgi:hypothetical protein